jgi:hypothetical protein
VALCFVAFDLVLISALHADIVFVIYLYQRWKYPVDKRRMHDEDDGTEVRSDKTQSFGAHVLNLRENRMFQQWIVQLASQHRPRPSQQVAPTNRIKTRKQRERKKMTRSVWIKPQFSKLVSFEKPPSRSTARGVPFLPSLGN